MISPLRALKAMAGPPEAIGDHRATIRAAVRVIESAREVLDIFDQHLRDQGECDHSVGICSCGEVRARDELAESLTHFYREGPEVVPAPFTDDGFRIKGAGWNDRPLTR